MHKKIKHIGRHLVYSNDFMSTFLRSGVSAQTSGLVDFVVSFVMFKWLFLTPLISAAIGAIAGGVVNFMLNYRFTFRVDDCPWKALAAKFSLVWVGSLLLNAGGTQLMYWILCRWHLLETIGFKPDGYFTAARLLVAIIVSLGFNFTLQRYFVYRKTRFDNIALAMTNLVMHGRIHHNKK